MALKDDLTAEVARIFRSPWTERDGETVPEDKDVGLGNDAVKLQGTVLYADLADSTVLVDQYPAAKPFVAEIYKTFLVCAARIVRSEGGVITAYDGDRIMAVYIGNAKNTSAVRTGMKINWAAKNIINPAIKVQYPKVTYTVKHVVGIDASDVFVARTGLRGANDLVWVGRSANYAAKLASRPETYATQITADIYNNINKVAKFTDEKDMWTALTWTEHKGLPIYGSNWTWEP